MPPSPLLPALLSRTLYAGAVYLVAIYLAHSLRLLSMSYFSIETDALSRSLSISSLGTFNALLNAPIYCVTILSP